jgi:glycosyltransferase involved in cell wall biosynthesis
VTAARRALTVGILADMLEENWASMDLVAETLMRELPAQDAWPVRPRLVRPTLVPVIRRVRRGANGAGTTADRVFNRFWLYRRALVGLPRRCDVFHVVDHSYAHLALALPRGRTVVTCHDTDTFRGFLTAGSIETGLPGFLVRRLAAGLARAALVVCPSQATAADVTSAKLADPGRVVVVPNGVDAEPGDAAADREAAALLASAAPTTDLLHVGSPIPRKRIDLLLDVFAVVARRHPEARLVRVGGPFSDEQAVQAARLGIRDRVLVLPFLTRQVLWAVYRRAALVLVTSDREGFGLPVLEGLSVGVPVLARELPPLREFAADACTFVDGDDPSRWAARAGQLLDERRRAPDAWTARCERARRVAKTYTWRRYAERMAGIYAAVAGQAGDARVDS